ncbi:sensor histidine kinase [Zavarzinia compransoris]|uniref:histidine kinase n=1 Tax=Zavarzinia compransoris TaxID=1264899 RepID=A0A317E7M3_9PROT|nr:ATP-binding protein [Zavarzinia compransoris]PWR23067.1 two-component sensor histidine kinase [Zavarzinia compransoris]TDP46385.1 signal transduction histidine kinase [Zavarzinia compransoris]
MSRASHLVRSTPFRLAVTFSSLLIVVFILSGTIVYRVMSADIADRLDETIDQTFAVVAAAYGENDLEDLVAAVGSHAAATDSSHQILALTDASGRRLAGNVVPAGVMPGFSDRAGTDFGLPDDERYRVFAGRIAGNLLIIGLSYAETEELRAIVITGFGWATLIAALLAVTAGAILAARVQRRLDAIATTMVEVSLGRLQARIPMIGNGDDIDIVSEQVNAALDRLASLVDSMRQVSADIAHDLKTPLNRLNITLEDLSGRVASPELSAALDEARGEMERINATFDALLRIAQIEAGARKARFKAVDLRLVAETIGDIYAEVAADGGKVLTLDLPPEGAAVINGDADLLTQLLANLVENAMRHCPAGTSISLLVQAVGRRVVVEVRDDGPGIPEPEHEKVFRRLYRMEKSRTTPGSGLGLSLVRAVADLHGAQISLKNADPGLRVIICFSASPEAGHPVP